MCSSDLRGRQAQVLGVEVLGLQPVLHRPVHPGYAGQVLGRRKEGLLLDIEFPFDLNNACRGHTEILRPALRRRHVGTTTVPVGTYWTGNAVSPWTAPRPGSHIHRPVRGHGCRATHFGT